jgi:hypothetical protein
MGDHAGKRRGVVKAALDHQLFDEQGSLGILFWRDFACVEL